MLLPTALLVAAPALAPDLPRIAFEHELEGGAVVALVAELRGDELHMVVEAAWPPGAERADLAPSLGEWIVGDGSEELFGEPVGVMPLGRVDATSLRTVERADWDQFASMPLTIGLDGFAAVELECEWAVGGEFHRERARFDGLAVGATLLGWTDFAQGAAAARASFFQGEDGCAVHLWLSNPGPEDLYVYGMGPAFARSFCQRPDDEQEREMRVETICQFGKDPAHPPTDEELERWRLAPRRAYTSVFKLDLDDPAELDIWGVKLAVPYAELEPPASVPTRWGYTFRTFRWARTTGVSVSVPEETAESE